MAQDLDDLSNRLLDLVQVTAPATGVGSGRLVARNLVLTARHVVGALDAPLPEAGIKVSRYTALRRGAAEPIPASLAWEAPQRPDKRYPDIVLLELKPSDGAAIDPHVRLGFAKCPAASQEAWAVGFPWRVTIDQARAGHGRTGDIAGKLPEYNIPGTCFAATAAPPSLLFTSKVQLGRPGEAAEKTAERWSGASGAAVVMHDRIVGVLASVDSALMPHNQLTTTPLADHADEKLRRLLSLEADLPLAAPRAAAPPVDLTELSAHLHTLNRKTELDLVELAFARGAAAPLEILITGHPDDLCLEFWKALWRRCLNRPGDAPHPIGWPGLRLGQSNRSQLLAAKAAREIGLSGAAPPALDALGASLAQATQPPWICIELPQAIGDDDLALLAAWRAAWSGARRNGDRPFGYVILHEAARESAQRLDIGDSDALRQAVIALGEIEPRDLQNWDRDLEGPLVQAGPSPLPRLARAMRERLPRPPSALRLAAVQRLLDGFDPAPPRGDLPAWDA